jgi:ABC-type polysaccharide/polyol phosphate export permease
VLRFVVFALSPILFPAEQLPGWLAAFSWWLPFGHMAAVVRDSLAPEMVADAPISSLTASSTPEVSEPPPCTSPPGPRP